MRLARLTYLYAHARKGKKVDNVYKKFTQAVKNVLEKEVEQYLRDKVKKAGGMAYKFVSPGNSGVPDRLVLFPEGRIAFVELKAKGKKSTPLQLAQQRRISGLGFPVYVVDDIAGVDRLIMQFAAGSEVMPL